jgi:hypothetical protein
MDFFELYRQSLYNYDHPPLTIAIASSLSPAMLNIYQSNSIQLFIHIINTIQHNFNYQVFKNFILDPKIALLKTLNHSIHR